MVVVLPTSNSEPVKGSSLLLMRTGLGVVLFAVVGALYVRTLAPSVMPGDYAEFQMCAAVLGVPHPTGYPLYVLLGKLFTFLPFGDVAYRVNLSSAIYMAGAAVMAYTIAATLADLMSDRARLYVPHMAVAACGAVLFAVAPTVWSMALVARSYALNALLVGSVVVALINWRRTGKAGWFYATGLLVGLSMVHHGTTYLLLPAYALYLLLVEAERRRHHTDAHPLRRWALGAAAFAVGLSPLLFLVYRFLFGAPYYWGNPTTWKDFFDLLTGGPFHNQIMGFGTGLDTQLQRIAYGISELSTQYTPAGIAAGLAGLAVLWRQRRAEAALLTLMMAGNFAFAMNYALVGYLYFIPTYLIWGVLIATFGVWVVHTAHTAYIAHTTRMAHTARAGRIVPSIALTAPVVTSVIVLAALGGAVWLALARYPAVDQSGQTATRDNVLALLNSVPQGASLYLDWEDLSVVRFYRMVYGMRPDLTLHTGDPADWAKWVYCDLQAGTPAYVGEFAGFIPPAITRDFVLAQAATPIVHMVVRPTNSALYEVPPCGTCATCR